ncbi:TPA: 50S ribosomal protein L4 [Patescibacteria group bacterium]|nr:50S ribosomal protein L4 [Patescibacteria group bacterium]
MAEKKTTTTKETKLNPMVWEVEYNEDLIAQVLYVYRNNERKGTSSTKTRAEVRGGGRKPWRQKGTGRARHGSIRSPIWVKGGVAFGSNNKNWKRKINKKMAKKAVCMMLSKRLIEKAVEFVNIGKRKVTGLRSSIVKMAGKKTLIISANKNIDLAVRNVEHVNFVDVNKVNVKHIVDCTKVIIDEGSVKILEERLVNGK